MVGIEKEVKMEYQVCLVCERRFGYPVGTLPEDTIICPPCARKIPRSLLKACVDPFSYALGLVDGRFIEFTEADIRGEWVNLKGQADGHGDHPLDKEMWGHRFFRGLEVRLDRIAWCADAPDGS